MVQLLKPRDTKVVTKDGECHVTISLELIIKLDGEGISVSPNVSHEKKNDEKESNLKWTIPDFSGGNKLNFGKE